METRKKILIIEDEKAVALALQTELEAEGYSVESSSDGESGMAQLLKNHYDLLILDLMLPKMDGFEILGELNKKGIKVPTIVSTNLGHRDDFQRTKKLGAINYFVKSDTSLETILTQIQNILPQNAGIRPS